MLHDLPISELAFFSARCNRRDLAAGRTVPRGNTERLRLALRIRARRATWHSWAAGDAGHNQVAAALDCLR